MSAEEKALFANSSASDLFELISTGRSARLYASLPEISYLPLSELSDAIRTFVPSDVLVDEHLKDQLATRASLQEMIYHFATLGQAKQDFVRAIAYHNNVELSRVTLSSERARIAAYPQSASPLQEYCRRLYRTLQRAALNATHDVTDFKVKTLKSLLKSPPLVVVMLDVSEHRLDSDTPVPSYWADVCEPLNDAACLDEVARVQKDQRFVRELGAQARMYMTMVQNVAVELFPQAPFLHSATALPPQNALFAHDDAISRHRHLLANHRRFQVRHFFKEDPRHTDRYRVAMLETAVTDFLGALSVPTEFSPEARAFFEEWKSSVTTKALVEEKLRLRRLQRLMVWEIVRLFLVIFEAFL